MGKHFLHVLCIYMYVQNKKKPGDTLKIKNGQWVILSSYQNKSMVLILFSIVSFQIPVPYFQYIKLIEYS